MNSLFKWFVSKLYRKDSRMTIESKASSIESSFRMEDMDFDSECIERVKGILSGEILVSENTQHWGSIWGNAATMAIPKELLK